MNELLLSLRVLSKVQANERLGQRKDGILSIERSNMTLCRIGRYIRGDSRVTTMRELDRIVTHAREKASDLLNSKFLDQESGVITQLSMLQSNLHASLAGMGALQKTYSEDANVVAQLDQIIARIQEITADIASQSRLVE